MTGSAIAAPTTAAPQTTAASAEAAADTTPTPTADQTAASSPLLLPASVWATPAQRQLMQMALSVWGMYQHADIVVKIVMIGLLLASVVTWALFFGIRGRIIGGQAPVAPRVAAAKRRTPQWWRPIFLPAA